MSPPVREQHSCRPTPTPDSARASGTEDRSSFSFKALALAALPLLGACTPQAQVPVHPPNECALVVIDSFEGSNHGETVTSTALKLGRINQVDKYDQAEALQSPDQLPFKQQTRILGATMGREGLTSSESSKLLDTFFEDVHVDSMGLITGRLEAVSENEYSRSAVNLSLGLSELSLVDLAESHLGSGDSVYRRNLTQALNLTNASGASNSEIKQALLDRAHSVLESSPRVESAKFGWQTAVQNFESDGNSVVVSAGNHGGALRKLRKQGYRVSDNADRNFLDVPEVTVVGATQSFLGNKSVTSYSRRGEGVDIHANGRTGLSMGTSFASPRVSAALRAIHCDNPSFSSDKAESFMAENFGVAFKNGLTDLDLKAVSVYIASESSS